MGHYVNVRKLRELGIIVATLTSEYEHLLDEFPASVRKRVKTILTYNEAILAAVCELIPPERRASLKHNIVNYQVQIIPKSQRAQTPEEATKWVLDLNQISMLMALDPDECMMCDRWTEEEQRVCPRRKILDSMDISLKCDNAFDEPTGCQWVEDDETQRKT